MLYLEGRKSVAAQFGVFNKIIESEIVQTFENEFRNTLFPLSQPRTVVLWELEETQ